MIPSFRTIFISALVLYGAWYFVSQTDNSEPLKLLPYEVKGNTQSNTLLVFFHGYPNTLRMWDRIVSKLQGDYRILTLSYPNFDEDVYRKWGLDLREVVRLAKDTIEHVEIADGKKYKKSIIGHDWGAVISILFDSTYKGYATQMMNLDIGAVMSRKLGTKVFSFCYQTYLASAFLIGGKIGDAMTKLFTNYYVEIYMNTDEIKDRINSSWNYFYYYLWRNILTYKTILEEYRPSVPFAFVYGTEKKHMFHSEEFLELLDKTPNCEHHGIEDNHWVMNKPKSEKFIIDLIRKRNK